ncbi:hypothetical protein DIPPA_26639 [Diplonema papillatum]|nr:hypothetical protein DIPPA_26639 [Diplonema papillatum]
MIIRYLLLPQRHLAARTASIIHHPRNRTTFRAQQRRAYSARDEQNASPDFATGPESIDEEEGDWVILGELDRPLPFEPTLEGGEDTVRAENEMYNLYRIILRKECSWLEMVDLFTVCDQEVVATAFMWAMYLHVIPTLFGIKREYARMLHYYHAYDVRTLNMMVLRLIQHRSPLEAYQLWEKSLIRSNKKITNPTVHSLNIMLEYMVPASIDEDEWWLDRGILYVRTPQPKRNTVLRLYVDRAYPFPVNGAQQVDIINLCFAAIERHKIQPNFSTLYLLSRVIPVEIDFGRHQAATLCMFMETLPDEVVPLEARLLVTEFLHWRLENYEINPAMSMMKGPFLTTGHKAMIFVDDCYNALVSPWREDSYVPPHGKRLGRNTVDIDSRAS